MKIASWNINSVRLRLDLLQEIKKKYDLNISVVDMIAKKWMCPIGGTDVLYSSEFIEYCKKLRENNN